MLIWPQKPWNLPQNVEIFWQIFLVSIILWILKIIMAYSWQSRFTSKMWIKEDLFSKGISGNFFFAMNTWHFLCWLKIYRSQVPFQYISWVNNCFYFETLQHWMTYTCNSSYKNVTYTPNSIGQMLGVHP